MDRIRMKIEGMSCGHCVSHVTRALETLDGVQVEHVEVGSATVRYDPRATSEERMAQAIADAGYGVTATAR